MKTETITMRIDATINPIMNDQLLRAWNNLFESSTTRTLTDIESEMLDELSKNIITCSKLIAIYQKENE